MKKLILFFAVVAAVTFSSCGKKAAPATEATDSTTVAAADTTTAAADTTVATADTTVAAK